MLKTLWRWFWTNDWPSKPSLPAPDADKIMVCDLCADPDIQVGCRTHNLVMCGHCTTFHSDHSRACTLYLLDVPTQWERRAYAQRYDIG